MRPKEQNNDCDSFFLRIGKATLTIFPCYFCFLCQFQSTFNQIQYQFVNHTFDLYSANLSAQELQLLVSTQSTKLVTQSPVNTV